MVGRNPIPHFWGGTYPQKMALGQDSDMQLLLIAIKMNGLYLKQAKRTEKVALYSVHLSENDNPCGYEVWIINIAPNEKIFGKEYPEREKPPSNEDFGSTAWSWKTLELAEKQHQELTK